MKPEEKANELIDEFYNENTHNYWGESDALKEAKQCALICVDEIMKIDILKCKIIGLTVHKPNEYMDFWKEVKQAILNQ